MSCRTLYYLFVNLLLISLQPLLDKTLFIFCTSANSIKSFISSTIPTRTAKNCPFCWAPGTNDSNLNPLMGSLWASYIFTLFMLDCQYFMKPPWSDDNSQLSAWLQTIERTGPSWACRKIICCRQHTKYNNGYHNVSLEWVLEQGTEDCHAAINWPVWIYIPSTGLACS